MSLLDDGRLQRMLVNTFKGIYCKGTVYTTLTVYDRYGEPSSVTNATPCSIQIDRMTEAMRGAEGAADTDRSAIVLADAGVDFDTDAQLSTDSGPYAGSRWLVMSIERDPAAAYFQCRVRRNPAV